MNISLFTVDYIINLFKDNKVYFYNVPFANKKNIKLLTHFIMTHKFKIIETINHLNTTEQIFHCEECKAVLFDVCISEGEVVFRTYPKIYFNCMLKISCQDLIVKMLLE